MLVDIGTEICPECDANETLAWADEIRKDSITREEVEKDYLICDTE